MPSQATPVQAEVHAVTQGSSVTSIGKAKILPRRISSIDFTEVASMM